MSGADARQNPRVNVSWRARVATGPDSFVEARAVNISTAGVGLLCECAFPVGMPLYIALSIPDRWDRTLYHTATLRAKVVFHAIAGSQFRVGASFTVIDAVTQKRIHDWMEKG